MLCLREWGIHHHTHALESSRKLKMCYYETWSKETFLLPMGKNDNRMTDNNNDKDQNEN